MSRRLIAATIVVVTAFVLMGPIGLAVGCGIVLIDGFAPRLTPFLPLIALVVMVTVVMVEGPFAHGSNFVSERPFSHRLGLVLVLTVLMFALSEWAERGERQGAAEEDADRAAEPPVGRPTEPSSARGVARGSLWSLAAVVLLSGSGFLFWLLGVRRFDDTVVGAAASLFSSVFFIVYLTSLGLPLLVTRHATDRSGQSTWVTAAALITTVATSVVASILFVAVAPESLLAPIGGRGVGAACLMAVMISMASLSTVVDARLAALLKWGTYFWRAVALTVLRLGSLALVSAGDDGGQLFVASVWAFGATALVLVPWIVRPAPGERLERPARPELVRLSRFAGSAYASQLAVQAPMFANPFIVLMAVDDAAYAEYYLAWGMAAVLLVAMQVIGQALLADASSQGADRQKTITALAIAVGLSGTATLVAVVGGTEIAGLLFGADNDTVGELMVPLFAGCIPAGISVIAVTEARLVGSTRSMLVSTAPYAVLTLAGVAIGATINEVQGATVGWAVGALMSAPIALVELRTLVGVGSRRDHDVEAVSKVG